ncbi:MAG: Gfo/Idh/MocA family oxidoreductase [Pyrinomonadaceae bacterium]
MKILKWGLIGAGDIARKRIAPALIDLPNCDLVSVSRGRAELAEAFAAAFGVKRWYANWSEMLTDEIDAVYIATPVFLHAEQTIAAAEAGKHVLCEKPMALNVEECDRMIAACTANNVKLGIAYYRRFYPVLERVRKVIASGEIGKNVFAQINAFEYFDPAPDNQRHWLLEKEKSGGGPMMDVGCHRLEVLTNLFGKIVRTESIVANAAFVRDVEDTAAVLLQFESEACAALIVTHASQESQDRLEIFGTKGSINIPVLNKGDIRIKTNAGEKTESHPPHANIHQPLIEDFANAVLSGLDPKVSGETGRQVAFLEEEIYRLD